MKQLSFEFMRRKKGLEKYTDDQIKEWVEMFQGGMSYRQVADQVEVPYPTVFWHIKKQLGLSGRRPGRKKTYVGMTETEIARARNLRKYDLTPEQFDAMLERQGGVCAICRKPPTGGNTSARCLHVDHDHVTGEIRGLLCSNHNVALGLFEDSPAFLRQAANYLEAARA